MTPSILPHAAIRLIRARYPEALVCTRCALVLATRRASWEKAELTEIERLEYVCAECRQEQTEAERAVAARRTNLERARAMMAERRAREAAPVLVPAFDEISQSAPARPRQSGRFRQVDVTRQFHPHKGGRPRRHPNGRAAHAAAQRAYRERRKKAGALA